MSSTTTLCRPGTSNPIPSESLSIRTKPSSTSSASRLARNSVPRTVERALGVRMVERTFPALFFNPGVEQTLEQRDDVQCRIRPFTEGHHVWGKPLHLPPCHPRRKGQPAPARQPSALSREKSGSDLQFETRTALGILAHHISAHIRHNGLRQSGHGSKAPQAIVATRAMIAAAARNPDLFRDFQADASLPSISRDNGESPLMLLFFQPPEKRTPYPIPVASSASLPPAASCPEDRFRKHIARRNNP